LRRIKNLVLYGIARALLGLLQLLPTRAALALGRALGRLGYRVARRERERALRNLIAAGPPALDEAARAAILRRMFAHVGESIAEYAQLRRLLRSPELVRFEPGSREVMEAAVAEGRGVLFVTGHLGNFELMAAALARLAPRAGVLFKPSYDPRFTRLLSDFRVANGMDGIDVTRPGHLVEATRLLRQGGALGLLIDQPPPAGEADRHVTTPFLGKPALTSRLAPVLARRTGAAVVVGCARRTGTCQHEVRLDRLQDPTDWRALEPALAALAAPLEAAILRCPEQWLWSLDRWRGTVPEQKSTPFCK
jgi:KDO2-lipid IV(A) lauroyltransferase